MRALLLVLALSLCGCPGFLSALGKVAQGAQYLGTVVDVAAAGADAYFARHPNREASDTVDEALYTARTSLQALDAILAMGDAATREDLATAKAGAMRAYIALRQLLDQLGVLTGTGPAGGAETDAPLPGPVDLPTGRAMWLVLADE